MIRNTGDRREYADYQCNIGNTGYSYANGGIVSAVIRALTPFHFVFGVMMGYPYGKARVEKKVWLSILTIAFVVFTIRAQNNQKYTEVICHESEGLK